MAYTLLGGVKKVIKVKNTEVDKTRVKTDPELGIKIVEMLNSNKTK